MRASIAESSTNSVSKIDRISRVSDLWRRKYDLFSLIWSKVARYPCFDTRFYFVEQHFNKRSVIWFKIT